MKTPSRTKLHEEILKTMPNLPLGDSFASLELSEESDLESLTHSCSDEKEPPMSKRPYVSVIQKIIKKTPTRNNKEENKTLFVKTERNTFNRYSNFKPNCGIDKNHHKKIKLATLTNEKSGKKCKKTIESNLLNEYWQKKAEIQKKYKDLMVKMDKELVIEINMKILKLKEDQDMLNGDIDELDEIKEYYENSKSLLNGQRIVEQEELLNQFKERIKRNF